MMSEVGGQMSDKPFVILSNAKNLIRQMGDWMQDV